MELLSFARKQYSAFTKASQALDEALAPTRNMANGDEKTQLIVKAYEAAKPVFEKIRQDKRDYQPKNILEKIFKPVIFSLLSFSLVNRIYGMDLVLKQNAVRAEVLGDAPAEVAKPLPEVPQPAAPAEEAVADAVEVPAPVAPVDADAAQFDPMHPDFKPAVNPVFVNDPFAGLNPFKA